MNFFPQSEFESRSFKLSQPEITRAKLKCKTPIHYAADRRISDMKTPVQQSSPSKTPRTAKTPKMMKVCLKIYLIIILH